MSTQLNEKLRRLEIAAQVVLDELLDEIKNDSTLVIKNHAHFKRLLQEGRVKVETVTLANHISGGRLWVGMIRHIKKADTTGVYLALEGDDSRGSFLGYEKASDWVFEGNLAKNIKVGYSYKLIEG
jgi:hypothetical protein